MGKTLCALCAALLSSAAQGAEDPNRLSKNGIVVEFSIGPTGGAAGTPIVHGDRAEVRFRVTSEATGQPMRNLKPGAWLDMGEQVPRPELAARECKDRAALYLRGTVGMRPLVDLNSYFLLVLNADPSISVVDPVVGVTGKTSLYASILVPRRPADWARSKDQRRLFVSMPRAGQVAVVDTETFKVTGNLDAGKEPTRVVVQPDGKYLWVGNDSTQAGASGVTVIDTELRKAVATLRTGRGHHEIAISTDSRWAFVTNRDDGTVTAIDVERLATAKQLKTGPQPVSVAYSPHSQSVYVADAKDGSITAIDADRLEVTARLRAEQGLGPMRFTDDGRFGFVASTSEHAVHVIDAAENRLVHRVPVAGKPFQIALTRAFAYVRLLDSERVAMIDLHAVAGGKPTVQYFAAGAKAPRLARDVGVADSISRASMEGAVFVASPGDDATYYYMEGMNAPVGSFGGYGHAVRAVTVVDRTVKEIEPGVYAAQFRVPAAGRYDVAFLLDSPSLLHCFAAEAQANPALAPDPGKLAVEYLELPKHAAPGQPARLRFKLTDPRTREPKRGLQDVTVLHYVAPGHGRAAIGAREIGDGVYEASPVPERAGALYVHVAAPSMGVKPGELPHRTVVVRDEKGGRARAAPRPREER